MILNRNSSVLLEQVSSLCPAKLQMILSQNHQRKGKSMSLNRNSSVILDKIWALCQVKLQIMVIKKNKKKDH
mgnify:CR=1 FL=1